MKNPILKQLSITFTALTDFEIRELEVIFSWSVQKPIFFDILKKGYAAFSKGEQSVKLTDPTNLKCHNRLNFSQFGWLTDILFLFPEQCIFS